MQRIIHRDANDHGCNPYDNDGHAVSNHCDTTKGEQPSESDGNHYPKNVRETFVAKGQQKPDKKQSDRDGQDAVFLDLRGIRHSNQRGAHS